MKPNIMFVIIIILLLAFTSSACTGTKKAPEPVEIHFQSTTTKSMSTGALIGDPYMDAIENFNKLNPLIKVIMDYVPESQMKQIEVNGEPMTILMFNFEDKLKLLESDASPDIISMSPGDIPLAESRNLLYNLLQISEAKEMDINKQILDLATINGKLLTVPYAANPNAIFFNKKLFDDAHILYPQGDWTWEEFRAISKKLGPASSPMLPYEIPTLDTLMGSREKGLLSPDGTTSIGYLDSPEAISSLQWLNAYYHDSGITTPKTLIDTFQEFSQHQVGMVMTGPMNLQWATEDRENIGLAPLPHFEDGKRVNPISFDGFGISQKSKHPLEALKFIEYLTLTVNEDSIKLAESYVPTSKLMAKTISQSSDPIKSIFVEELNYATKGTDRRFFDAWFGDEDINSLFEKLLTTKDEDIPAKLHELALMVDQEMLRLKSSEDEK